MEISRGKNSNICEGVEVGFEMYILETTINDIYFINNQCH